MKKMIKTVQRPALYLAVFYTVLYLSACAVKPASELDNPEYHHKAGMRHVDMRQYEDALISFKRAVDLDKKFAPAYAGIGIVHANLTNKKEAKKYAAKAEGLGSKDADVLTLCARVWIDLRGQDKKWYKSAEKLLKKAMKREKNHEGATYYTGEMYLYRYMFSEAENQFRLVVEMKGQYSRPADKMWQTSQKIVRAMPGTAMGKKVALYEQITRADLAALMGEELKISVIMGKRTTPASGFQTPNQIRSTAAGSGGPSDSKGHWAETWINELSQYGIMEGVPGQPFYPDEPVNRAEYCMAIQRLLTIVTGDAGLEMRYFGETPSRFQDVPSSHPGYNAMALCAERGFIQADMITGRFDPTKPVSGADALLSIRSFQNALRMTF